MAKENGVWRTINGVHVFIRDGESPTDAVNRAIAKKNEDTKQAQLAKNKAVADKLNGKTPSQDKAPTKNQPVEYKGYTVHFDGDNYVISFTAGDKKFKTYDAVKAFVDKQPAPFEKGRVVVARDGYLDKGEKLEDTAEIVLSHKPENNYLVTGTLHPEKYAIPPTFSRFGGYYRYATEEELKKWGLK